jgi:hypothetical protein
MVADREHVDRADASTRPDQYHLSIAALSGAGTYRVEIRIGSTTVGPVSFDLE